MFYISVSDQTFVVMYLVFFFQAEDGIRDLVRSRGLGDVYKRQVFRLAISLVYFINGVQR